MNRDNMATRTLGELFEIAEDLNKIKDRLYTSKERCGDAEAAIGYQNELEYHKHQLQRFMTLIGPIEDAEMARLEAETRHYSYPHEKLNPLPNLKDSYGLIKDKWEWQERKLTERERDDYIALYGRAPDTIKAPPTSYDAYAKWKNNAP